jgi:putative ABC transport system substrate-binding protein
VNRREFIRLAGGGAAAWPFAAQAQNGERVRRVGVLAHLAGTDPEMQKRIALFREELERLGWSQGRNVHIDIRFAPAGTQARMLAQELVSLKPDVILGYTVAIVAALKGESQTIPIVFVDVSDPVGSGFIVSLARPGGNLTGFMSYDASIAGKWLTMLKEISPSLTRAAVLANPKTSNYDYYLRPAAALASSLGIELLPHPVETATDIERSIDLFARIPNGGLVVPPDPTPAVHRKVIFASAARHRLPAVYSMRYQVVDGGLMSYGTDRVEQMRPAASYVDRILRGANPRDLPVQAPVKFETVVNLKTARALGFEVPPSLLARADEVIE